MPTRTTRKGAHLLGRAASCHWRCPRGRVCRPVSFRSRLSCSASRCLPCGIDGRVAFRGGVASALNPLMHFTWHGKGPRVIRTCMRRISERNSQANQRTVGISEDNEDGRRSNGNGHYGIQRCESACKIGRRLEWALRTGHNQVNSLTMRRTC